MLGDDNTFARNCVLAYHNWLELLKKISKKYQEFKGIPPIHPKFYVNAGGGEGRGGKRRGGEGQRGEEGRGWEEGREGREGERAPRRRCFTTESTRSGSRLRFDNNE